MLVKLLGPVHKNEGLEPDVVPLSCTLEELQFNCPLTEAVAPGGVVFCTTRAVSDDTQPLEPVELRVYTPGAPAVGFCCELEKPPGPVQE